MAPEFNLYALYQTEAFSPQLASIISGFLKAIQLFSPGPLSYLRIPSADVCGKAYH